MPANVFPVWGAIGGRTQVVFLGSNGTIYAVGDEGSLIDAGRTSSTAWGATTLPLPAGVTACDVAKWEGTADNGGAGFLVFMTYSGVLYITGPNATSVRAGATSNVFNTVTLPTGVTAVDFAVGYRTLLILGSNGNLYASGDQMYRGNATGSINQTTPLVLVTQPPTSVAGLGGIQQIEAGRSSYYVLDVDGTIHVLGENSDGQLGDNTTTDRTSWTKVGAGGCSGGVLDDVVYISAVGTHDENSKSASAILDDGTLRSWGDNDQHAIGGPVDGTIYDCPLIPAGSGNNVIAVASGGHITPYMNSNSPTEVCNVGHNADGGFGDGTEDDRSSYECNSIGSDVCDPISFADLRLTKTVNNPAPNVGSNVIFTVTVFNDGPDNASGVEVGDLLPSGYTYVNSTPSQGSYNSGTGVWLVGAINNSASANITITATVLGAGSYANTAQVTASLQNDPDSSPNNNNANEDDQATSTPVPVSGADLRLTKTVNNSTPNVGSNVIFTVTVFNDGPSNATGVTVGDLLPSGYSYVSSTPSQGSYNSGTGAWTVGSINNSASANITITATVLASGMYANTAQVTASGQTDPDSSPNNNNPAEDDQATATTTPQIADLEITKTVDDNTPIVGTNVVFTITVSNDGPDAATNVTVEDVLPAGLTYVSDNSGGDYNSGTGIWTVGTINNGANASIEITATVTTAGNKTNYAQVDDSDQYDPNSTPGDNSATDDDDDAVTIMPCPQSATCNLPANVNQQGCAIPSALTNPNDVFTIQACGQTVTMSSNDNGDVNVCGDGDGADFIRIYTLYFNGVPFTQCTQHIIINDNTPPQIVDKPDYALAGCNPAWPSLTTTWTDNCSAGGVIAASAGPVQTNGCSESRVYTFTVVDGCGNPDTETTTVTRSTDAANPEIVDLANYALPGCNAAWPTTLTTTWTDNCSGSGTVTATAGTVTTNGCTQSRVYTFTKTDGCGNTDVETTTVTRTYDVTKPVFTNVPANVTVQCNNIPPVGTAVATDNCGTPTVVNNLEVRTNGACPDSYTLTRKWTATDACGNTKTATQKITVVDNTKPMFTFVPANLVLECSDPVPPMGTPTASDNCDASVTITELGEVCIYSNCPANRQLRRTWRATDNCGNSTTAMQIIDIQDTQKPNFTFVPQHITIECSALFPVTPGTPTATDACDPIVQITFNGQTSVAGSCPQEYVVTRQWTATDDCGNTRTATQTITVEDTAPPVFNNAPANTTVMCGMVPPAPVVTATDNCDTYVPVTFNENNGGPNCPYTITRTWTAVDDCGNPRTHTQTITVGALPINGPAGPESIEAKIPESRQTGDKAGTLKALLAPNPALEEVWISFEVETDEEATLRLFDVNGRLAIQQSFNALAGPNRYRLDLSGLSGGGLYTVQLLVGDRRTVERLVILSK